MVRLRVIGRVACGQAWCGTPDCLVSQGSAEMKVSKSGVVAYYLPDLLGETPEQFEAL